MLIKHLCSVNSTLLIFVYFEILAYPNAKISPPKRGDSDFMMRSNKLNSDVDMLYDQLRSKVDLNWERLQMEFKALDPTGSGYVGKEEFKVRW